MSTTTDKQYLRDAISRTSDQFRQRLTDLYIKTENGTLAALPHAMVNDIPAYAVRVAMMEAIIAVYAEALRDAKRAFRDDPNDEPYSKVDTEYVIETLAAEHGIDLGEQP